MSCQSTPESASVDNKNNDIKTKLDETTQVTNEKVFLKDASFPEHVEDELELKNTTISIDANINTPDSTTLMCAEFIPMAITQEWSDSLIGHFADINQLQKRTSNERLKEDYENEIISLKELIFTCENDWDSIKYKDPYRDYTNENDAISAFEEQIIMMQELMQEAPSEYQYVPISSELKPIEDSNSQGIVAYVDISTDGNPKYAHIVVTGSENETASFTYENVVESTQSAENMQWDDQSLPSLDEARAIAQKEAALLGIGDISLSSYSTRAQIKDGKEAPYYSLVFNKEYNGVPLEKYTDIFSLESVEEYASPLHEEMVFIGVDNTGVISLSWFGIKEQINIIEEDVAILEFDYIWDIFNQKIQQRIFLEGKELQIDISNINLSLMLIRDKDSSSFISVPVWNFTGYHYDKNKEGETEDLSGGMWTYLTINAIDGTVINSGLGY